MNVPVLALGAASLFGLGGLAGWLLRARRDRALQQPDPIPPLEPADDGDTTELGALVPGVAHAVRNPLFSALATLDAFDARFGTLREYQQHTGMIRNELNRITALIDQLVEYGRPRRLVFAEGRLNDALNRTLEVVGPLARQAEVRVSVVTAGLDDGADGANPRLRLDTERLVRALSRPLENAIQFSPPGAEVQLLISRPDRLTVVLDVVDGGSGLPLDARPEQVFEPFFARRRGGAGLGLSIAQGIVEKHGGSLQAARRPEGGTCVSVRLPVLESVRLIESSRVTATGSNLPGGPASALTLPSGARRAGLE